MELWDDGLFWALFIGGLLSYLLGVLVSGYTLAFLIGDLLWLSAFVYLTVKFLQKNFGKPQSG